MKRLLIMAGLTMLLTAGVSAATRRSSLASFGANTAEMSLDIAGEPASGFGSAIGVTFGGSLEIQKNLSAIGHISYYNWSRGVYGIDLSYSRVPISGGLRAYLPTQNDQLKLFGQGELEFSIDSKDVSAGSALRSSQDDVHVGLVPGFGVDYAFDSQWSTMAAFKYHIIHDAFFVFSFGAAYHF